MKSSLARENGLVSDFINTFKDYVQRELSLDQEVYLVFDRHHTDSIKGHTRACRAAGYTRKFHLQITSVIPSQKVVLSVAQNKMQMTYLIMQNLSEDPIVSRHRLLVTGLDEVPMAIQFGVVSPFPDLKTSHEEADVIIINQLLWSIKTNQSDSFKIVCDDTDVFALMSISRE